MKVSVRVNTVGELPKQDQENFMEWVWQARDKNCFDPDVMSYPRTVVLTAEDENGPILYLPVQPTLQLESLAPKPGLTPRKEAYALWKMGEALEGISQATGIYETYFLCKDSRVSEICSKHGFEKMEGYSILKKKVKPVAVQSEELTEGTQCKESPQE